MKIDSRSSSRTTTTKKVSSYVVTSSDQLVGTLMFDYNMMIDDAHAIIERFEETNWSDSASKRRLRRLVRRKVDDEEVSAKVLSFLQRKAREASA